MAAMHQAEASFKGQNHTAQLQPGQPLLQSLVGASHPEQQCDIRA